MRKNTKTRAEKQTIKKEGRFQKVTISKEVLTQMDKSIESIKNGSLYGPIDLKQ